MNLPNKLTVIRMVMVPIFVWAMLSTDVAFHYVWALALFAAASFTDYLDGFIARKYNLVTNFGKFMDPLADKILVMSALICFIPAFDLSPVVVIIVMAREFVVTSLRLIAASEGVVIAADGWGKAKTASTMLWIIVTLLAAGAGWDNGLTNTLYNAGMLVTTALTIISGFNYIWNNRTLLAAGR